LETPFGLFVACTTLQLSTLKHLPFYRPRDYIIQARLETTHY